jgi:hypothetical protein
MSMLEKLNVYWNAAFVRHTGDYETALWFRHASRWWLDFFRNLVVVSTVYYLAERSDSTVLKIFFLCVLRRSYRVHEQLLQHLVIPLFPLHQKSQDELLGQWPHQL